MAIEAFYLQLLQQAIGKAKAGRESASALLLGYPDLLVPRAALTRMFGEHLVASLPTRDDAAAIWEWHGLRGVQDPMFDSVALLRALGVEPVIVDVARTRGVETLVDLNHPLPAELARRFDLVVDTGTCEHCFNVGQALLNACEALAAGGILVHAAPLTRINHGFWNFSPTVYPDFFEENGFELQLLTGVQGDLASGMRPFEVDPFRRFDAPANAALYVIARRAQVRDLHWPMQRKYRSAAR